MMTTQQRIGRQIRAFRALRGMSQSVLAHRAGLIQEHVSRYERGAWKICDPDHLFAIAAALEVRIDALLTQGDES